jgi:broad specificity phosphatase PhoE
VADFPSLRLAFVRHAQARASDDSYDERTPLSPLGRRQAEATARMLLERGPFEALYSSPLPRCVETATPSCEALRLDPVIDQRLVEFEFESHTLPAALKRPDLLIWDGVHRGHPAGETLREFSERIYEWLDEVVTRHSGVDVVVFTHSGVIDAAIRWGLGFSVDAPWMHDFAVANASLTELEFWPRGRVAGGAPRYTEFRRMAQTTHLLDCHSSM